MGYTLTIGEAYLDYDNDESSPYCRVCAKGVTHDDAPAFGEPTDHSNSRWPSYSGWHDFAGYSGLYSLFFGKEHKDGYLVRDDALLVEHPGAVPLAEQHRREINAALERWKTLYPHAVPTYGNIDPKKFNDTDPDNPEENWKMTRLVWLHYWVNWALDNCDRPVFANS